MRQHVEANDEERDGLKTCTCDAFPNGIPAVMEGGELEPRFRRLWNKPQSGKDGWQKGSHGLRPWLFDHRYPYPGDNGILFERETEEDTQRRKVMMAAWYEELCKPREERETQL
jgi:hypothetical protein